MHIVQGVSYKFFEDLLDEKKTFFDEVALDQIKVAIINSFLD